MVETLSYQNSPRYSYPAAMEEDDIIKSTRLLLSQLKNEEDFSEATGAEEEKSHDIKT